MQKKKLYSNWQIISSPYNKYFLTYKKYLKTIFFVELLTIQKIHMNIKSCAYVPIFEIFNLNKITTY